jgi:hypothetical protein
MGLANVILNGRHSSRSERFFSHARQLGLKGKEHIRNNYLITRHIRAYLLLFVSLFYEGDVVYL